MDYSYTDIAKLIDHSLLQPNLGDTELEQGCGIALRYNVASVCIKPYWVRRAAPLLADGPVAVGTTIGFPHGGHSTKVKLLEADQAIADGATELDMVVNLGDVLSGNWPAVTAEISDLVRLAHSQEAIVKVIFENCYLQDEQKIQLCRLCAEAGVDYVKTSTGYGSGGATVQDVRLMRQQTPSRVGVKAAGGVRDLEAVLTMRSAGASRIGASRTVAILDEAKRRLEAGQ